MASNPKYGSKGEVWHPNFIQYMEFIANHEVYAGMPDAPSYRIVKSALTSVTLV